MEDDLLRILDQKLRVSPQGLVVYYPSPSLKYLNVDLAPSVRHGYLHMPKVINPTFWQDS